MKIENVKKTVRTLSILSSLTWIGLFFINKVAAVWVIFLNLVLHHTWLILSNKIPIYKNPQVQLVNLAGALLGYSACFSIVFYFLHKESLLLTIIIAFFSLLIIYQNKLRK